MISSFDPDIKRRMFGEEDFQRATERLKPYDALFGDDGNWARMRELPPGGVTELIGQLHDYAEALKALPLLPEYVASQYKASMVVVEAIKGEPELVNLAWNYPRCDTPFPPHYSVRKVTDEFHDDVMAAVPLIQRMCGLHADASGVPPARFETYRSETQDTIPGHTMGYDKGKMGHPTGSTTMDEFTSVVMFVVHEGSHHVQLTMIDQLERNELKPGSWQHWQARIFRNDMQNGRGVDGRNFMPEFFGGDERPLIASREAYKQNPLERAALFFGDLAENEIRRWLGMKERTPDLRPEELGLAPDGKLLLPIPGLASSPSP